MLDGISELPRILGSVLGSVFPLTARGPGRPPLDDTPEAALRSERREIILRIVRKQPGLGVTDLRRLTGLGAGIFYLHLHKLMRAGLIEKRDLGGRKRVFPAGEVPRNFPVPPSDPLEAGSARKVAEAFLEKPGRTSAQIAVMVRLTQRMVQNHIRALVEAGYLVQEPGWPPTFTPTRKLRRALGGE